MARTKREKSEIQSLSDIMTIPEDNEKIDVNATSTGRADIEDTAMIKVRSNVYGGLYYIDPVTKEEVSWLQCGDTQILTMGMLRNMKRGAVKFFVNNLVIITGFADENDEKYKVGDIYKSLSIQQYYKNYLDPTDYEDICSWTPSEIKSRVSLLSEGAKRQLVVALNTFIERGILDSLKTIKTFEEVLGCELSDTR